MLTKKQIYVMFSGSTKNIMKDVISGNFEVISNQSKFQYLNRRVRKLTDQCYDPSGTKIIKFKKFFMGLLSILEEAALLNRSFNNAFTQKLREVLYSTLEDFLTAVNPRVILEFYQELSRLEIAGSEYKFLTVQTQLKEGFFKLIGKKLFQIVHSLACGKINDLSTDEFILLEEYAEKFIKLQYDKYNKVNFSEEYTLFKGMINNLNVIVSLSGTLKYFYLFNKLQFQIQLFEMELTAKLLAENTLVTIPSDYFEKVMWVSHIHLQQMFSKSLANIVTLYLSDIYFSKNDQPGQNTLTAPTDYFETVKGVAHITFHPILPKTLAELIISYISMADFSENTLAKESESQILPLYEAKLVPVFMEKWNNDFKFQDLVKNNIFALPADKKALKNAMNDLPQMQVKMVKILKNPIINGLLGSEYLFKCKQEIEDCLDLTDASQWMEKILGSLKEKQDLYPIPLLELEKLLAELRDLQSVVTESKKIRGNPNLPPVILRA